jgi:NADH:ubiquinone oxidoreductase subunit 6 (subunit J)
MQRAFDRLDQQENRTQLKWTVGIAAAFGLIMLALVALTWTPTVTSWVSDATQAEFAASTMMPDTAPVQIVAGRAH